MDIKKLAEGSTPKKLGAYLVRQEKSPHRDHGSKGHAESIRTIEHAGHRIVIHTAYKVTVDGKALDAPLGVDDAGQVHCHSLPNYQTASAVDMVKSIIDNFPDEFMKKSRSTRKAAPKRKASKQ